MNPQVNYGVYMKEMKKISDKSCIPLYTLHLMFNNKALQYLRRDEKLGKSVNYRNPAPQYDRALEVLKQYTRSM